MAGVESYPPGDYDVAGDGEEAAPQQGGSDNEPGYERHGGGDGEQGYDLAAVAGLSENEDITNSLPPFANAKNRELHAQILAKQAALAVASTEAADHSERLAIMQDHLKNVRSELTNAQGLLEARQREQATEEHLKSLTERAVGRMRQEIAALDKRSDAVSEQIAGVQASIYRGSERLEVFRDAMHMAQGELDKWAAKARIKEEDNLAIEKYARGDEFKIRDIVREQERLTVAVTARRKELEREVTETRAKQVELDKLANDFRALHSERQDLIKQWQDNLDLIQRRDGDVAKAAERFARMKVAVADRRQKVNEQEGMVNRLRVENVEMEGKIEVKKRLNGQLLDDEKKLKERADRFRDEVELLKTNVTAAASELLAKNQAVRAAEGNLVAKQKQIESARKLLEEIRARLAHATAQVASAESALAERENYMEREEARVEVAERRLALLKDQLFKANEAVKKLTEDEATLTSEIQGSRRTSRNLSDRIRELDAQSLAQQEHVYAAEFQIQQMERKIARAKGEVSDEEKKILEARIVEVNAELAENVELEKGLQAQCKQVKDDLKKALRAQTELTQQLIDVQAKIDEILLQNRSAEDTLRKAVKEKEEAMVTHDVLKLEIRKLRDTLSVRTDEVFGLENRAAQLAMTMESRKREVEADRAVTRAQAKFVEEERHKLALDLADRQSKISLLKTKYEILCARMRGSDESGEPRSQAYFILKAAQKREELQREGDELDASIRKAEKEVKALAATLTHLSARNTALREAFHRVDPGGDEAASIRALEQQLKDTADALFKRKRELAALHTQIEEGYAKLADNEERITALDTQLAGLHAARERVEGELATQAGALAATQARVQAAKMRRRLRVREGGGSGRRSRPASAGDDASGETVSEPSADEIAFIAQGIKECSSSVLFTLGQLAKEFPQLRTSLGSALTELGLKMPNRPPARMPTTTNTSTTNTSTGGGGASGLPPPGAAPRAPLPPRTGTTTVPTTPLAFAPTPGGGESSGLRTPGGGMGSGGFSASTSSLRRPPSASSLTGAGRTILAGRPAAGIAHSPMAAASGSAVSGGPDGRRPFSAASQGSARSAGSGSGSMSGKAGPTGGGLDLGLNGRGVNAARGSTPTGRAER